MHKNRVDNLLRNALIPFAFSVGLLLLAVSVYMLFSDQTKEVQANYVETVGLVFLSMVNTIPVIIGFYTFMLPFSRK